MRVELNLNLGSNREPASRNLERNSETREAAVSRNRENRKLQRIALARIITLAIDSGRFSDLADVSRRCAVSRACISKLVECALVAKGSR